MYKINVFVILFLLSCNTNDTNTVRDNKSAEIFVDQYGDSIEVSYVNRDKVRSTIINGERNGEYKVFFGNSSILKETGTFLKGKKVGLIKKLSKNGKVLDVQFLSESGIRKVDPIDFNFSKKFISRRNLTIEVPFQWYTKTLDSGNVLLVSVKVNNDSLGFNTNLNLVYENFNESDPKKYVSENMNKISLRMEDFQVGLVSEIKLNGNQSFVVNYRGKAFGKTVGGITCLIFKERYIYILTGLCEYEDMAYKTFSSLFMEVAKTIKIN